LIVDKLSSFLHEIHNLKNEKFNSFINDNYETYLDMLNERLNRHIQAIGVYENDFSASLSVLVKKIQELIPMSNIIPSFLHFDFKPQNIIFHEETLNINVIDFEHSRFGDPLHELIRSKYRVMKNELFLQQLWSKIEYEYIKKSNIEINSHRILFYQIYYCIAELPYLFRIKDTTAIIEMKNTIERIASNDFPC
jgi:aminoglycoside phosphotransferase (APT) family kinase protein